uniref:hypothetical protein n=1 Tax=uncultured Draconibacterium sp. TaxID=1573823 RepID=UPI003217459A
MFCLFFSTLVFAQAEDSTRLIPGLPPFENELHTSILFPSIFPEINFEQSLFSNNPSLKLHMFDSPETHNSFLAGITFKQSKMEMLLPNLVRSQHFQNRIIYNPSSKISFEIGVGLVQQNSVLSAFQPNYQLSFKTLLEYEISNWLSAYLYGQYITLPLNQSQKSLDPLIYMNPNFIQTEFGGGLRTKYKNIKADMGLRKIYDTQFNQSNPVQFMDTKVTIGF